MQSMIRNLFTYHNGTVTLKHTNFHFWRNTPFVFSDSATGTTFVENVVTATIQRDHKRIVDRNISLIHHLHQFNILEILNFINVVSTTMHIISLEECKGFDAEYYYFFYTPPVSLSFHLVDRFQCRATT